jgi:hypothetical protein
MLQLTFEEIGSPIPLKDILYAIKAEISSGLYCHHSILITRDVMFVPPAPAAALYLPVEVIIEDEQEDSGGALKPSKADSHTDTQLHAESKQCQNNEETFDIITVKGPAPRTADNDDATRAVVGPLRS